MEYLWVPYNTRREELKSKDRWPDELRGTLDVRVLNANKRGYDDRRSARDYARVQPIDYFSFAPNRRGSRYSTSHVRGSSYFEDSSDEEEEEYLSRFGTTYEKKLKEQRKKFFQAPESDSDDDEYYFE